MLCPVPRLWLRRFALIAKNLSLVTRCKIADTGQVLVGSVNLRDGERLDASAGARAAGWNSYFLHGEPERVRSFSSFVGRCLSLLPAIALYPSRFPQPSRLATVPVRPITTGALAQLSSLSQWHTDASREHYLAVAAVQAFLLRLSADLGGQFLRHSAFDPQHAIRMASIGVVVSSVGAVWLSFLDRAAYLFLLPLLAGLGLSGAAASVQANLPFAMGVELALFTPYNLFAFSMLPLHRRPLASSLLSSLFIVSIATVV